MSCYGAGSGCRVWTIWLQGERGLGEAGKEREKGWVRQGRREREGAG